MGEERIEENDGEDASQQRPCDVDYGKTKSCCVFAARNPIRAACIRWASQAWFTNGVMLLILINCIILCFYDPVAEVVNANKQLPDVSSWRNDMAKVADWPLLILFSMEMTTKIIAMGFVFGPNT